MPDILIRNVPQKTIAKIDRQKSQLNSKRKKKISRNSFLKMVLENELDIERDQYQRTQYELMLKHDIELNEIQIKLMTKIIHLFAEGNVTEAINYVDSLDESLGGKS